MLEPILLVVAGGGGLGALVFAALRFNREDSTAAVTLMRSLNDELVEALDRCRAERVELQNAKRDADRQLLLKEAEIRSLEAQLERRRKDGRDDA